jgi:hypothetical protein
MAPRSLPFQKDHSRAYNLAQAAGLYDAKDYTLPKDQRDGLISDSWEATSNTLLFHSSHGLGLNWGSSIGLGVASLLLAPKGVMERDSVFGWVPVSQADNPEKAREVMSETLVAGIETALSRAEITYKVDYRNTPQSVLFTHYVFSQVRIIAPEQGCPSWEESGRMIEKTCYFYIAVFSPEKTPRPIPEFIIRNQNGYAFFANDPGEYSAILVNLPEGAQLDKTRLLATISRELPEWVFIFVASTKQADGRYSAPLVLEQGKPNFFITPVEDSSN